MADAANSQKDKIYCAVGMMSGTSMDGIDIAVIYTDGESVERSGPSTSVPYTPEMREAIAAALVTASQCRDKTNPPEEITKLETLITEMHVSALNAFLDQEGLHADDIDVIGMHGQTIIHRPEHGWTWQLADGPLLASKTGVTAVTDFRSNDMENGGEGAPLVPLHHLAMLKKSRPADIIAILNIGGVANVTWLDFSKDADNPDILAFDTGPGNALLDDWALVHTGTPCDVDGALAARGVVHADVMASLMDSPYFDESPPKTLDREDFDPQVVRGLSPEDGAATLTDFVVESVCAAQSHFPKPVDAWYVCGGGRHNPKLMRRLRRRVPVMLDPVDVLGWQGDALEAEAFAFLAVRALKGLPLSVPSTTGVNKPVSGGVISKEK